MVAPISTHLTAVGFFPARDYLVLPRGGIVLWGNFSGAISLADMSKQCALVGLQFDIES